MPVRVMSLLAKPSSVLVATTALVTLAATVVDAAHRHGARRMMRENTEEHVTAFYRRNTQERRIPNQLPPLRASQNVGADAPDLPQR